MEGLVWGVGRIAINSSSYRLFKYVHFFVTFWIFFYRRKKSLRVVWSSSGLVLLYALQVWILLGFVLLCCPPGNSSSRTVQLAFPTAVFVGGLGVWKQSGNKTTQRFQKSRRKQIFKAFWRNTSMSEVQYPCRNTWSYALCTLRLAIIVEQTCLVPRGTLPRPQK